MKKLLLIGLAVVLLVFLLVPSLETANENQMTEGPQESEMAENGNSTEGTDETKVDENNTTTEPNETTEPSETTIQTDGGEDSNDEEYAGSGSYDDFFDKYTIVLPPVSSDKRISVFVDGVDSMLDVLNATVIHTAEGEPIIRHKNKVYILEGDTVAREVGSIWAAGDEAAEYYMRDGDYVFTLNMELVDIIVYYGYINSRYSAGLRYYDLENVSSVRLEVSNFASKEVRCFLISEDGETEITPGELPEELWGAFGYDPNK